MFPQELKIAKVMKTNFGLSNFSKIIKQIIKVRVPKFIQHNYGIGPQQYGFQAGSNMLGNTVDLLGYVTEELDKNKYIVAVLVDLKKAFDTVNIVM